METTDTSIEAYLKKLPKRRRDIYLIYSSIKNHGPMTRDGIAQCTGLSSGSVCARVADCIRGHILVETDQRAKTRTGCKARVLDVLPKSQWDMALALQRAGSHKKFNLQDSQRIVDLIRKRHADGYPIDLYTLTNILNEALS